MTRDDTRLLVLAKEPVPGNVKTRLSPPCTQDEATAIARAALLDTLDTALTLGLRTVLVLNGDPGSWVPPGIEVLPQRGRGLDERLAAAFEDAGAPGMLVGMDTPQMTPALLSGAVDSLWDVGTDGVLGRAEDGGWWCIGLRRADPRVFLGVPMGTSFTGAVQLRRLRALGLRCTELPRLRDVDDFEDAVAVTATIPGSRFASAVLPIADRLESVPR
jgi:rSAM/selenodomain-associated transferase 1